MGGDRQPQAFRYAVLHPKNLVTQAERVGSFPA